MFLLVYSLTVKLTLCGVQLYKLEQMYATLVSVTVTTIKTQNNSITSKNSPS